MQCLCGHGLRNTPAATAYMGRRCERFLASPPLPSRRRDCVRACSLTASRFWRRTLSVWPKHPCSHCCSTRRRRPQLDRGGRHRTPSGGNAYPGTMATIMSLRQMLLALYSLRRAGYRRPLSRSRRGHGAALATVTACCYTEGWWPFAVQVYMWIGCGRSTMSCDSC